MLGVICVVMARRSFQQRRHNIVYVVSIWCYLVQQVVCLLMYCNMTCRSITDDSCKVSQALPYDCEVYRLRFLLSKTRTTNVNLISMLQMNCTKFCKLWTVLQHVDGLTRTIQGDASLRMTSCSVVG